MNLCRRILFMLSIVMMSSLVSFAADGNVMKWTVEGVQREALVFPPSAKVAAGKIPLVFAFHGRGGDMQEIASAMRIETTWPEALVVYMQGLATKSKFDPQGISTGWQHDADELGGADLKFFDAALATLRAKYAVDDRRIYATGFSNGAIFTYLLWSARGKTFAAFAPCAGRIYTAVHLSEPKPVLHIGGDRDDVVKFADQVQSIETARKLNGSTGTGTSCGPNCTTYSSTQDAPVVTYIHHGGHVFPPEASAMIVKFFKSYALAP